MPTRDFNFDTLPTQGSIRYCSVTHLLVYRYSNTFSFKIKTQNKSNTFALILSFGLNLGEVLNSWIFLETGKHFQVVPELLQKVWNNWELRLLVLLSLTLQLSLFHFGRQRRYNVKIRIHIFMWFCYLMADSVATIALGVISSKNRNFGNNNPKVHNELTAF